MAIRSILAGCGAYLPDRVIDNNELAKLVDTSDDWIKQRTGIEKRHVVADGELTSDLAVKAADRALSRANLASSRGPPDRRARCPTNGGLRKLPMNRAHYVGS